jgi:hypothetical protein
MLAWKSKFPVQRMTTPNTCWIDGAIYALKVRDSATGALYGSYQEAYAASHLPEFTALACAGTAMASSLKLKTGEMTGYSTSNVGYPSNMQPALAYAVNAGVPGAQAAWSQFMARSVKPDYTKGPQFAIVPR